MSDRNEVVAILDSDHFRQDSLHKGMLSDSKTARATRVVKVRQTSSLVRFKVHRYCTHPHVHSNQAPPTHLTCFSLAECVILILKSVSHSLLNEIACLLTPVHGPSTNA